MEKNKEHQYKDAPMCGNDPEMLNNLHQKDHIDEIDPELKKDQPAGCGVGLREDKIEELTATLKRVQAEFVNYKQRTERDRAQHIQQANRDLLKQIVSIVDIFELAFKHADKDNEHVKGFEMIYQQLLDLLKRNGVTLIDQIDIAMDPALHEVVGKEGKGKEGFVSAIVEKGYKLHDYVIRAAKVHTYNK